MQTQRVIRFKGVWSGGVHYHAGDVSVVGPWSFEALVDHVAGTQSEPNRGGEWASFWKPSDGVVAGIAPAQHLAPAQQPAAPQSTVVAFPALAPAPAPVQLSAPFALAPLAPAPSLPVPVSLPPPLPAAPIGELSASQIHDDSKEGSLNLAFALDSIRQQMAQCARRDDVAGVLSELGQRLIRLERLLAMEETDAPLDPVIAEAWRRKCEFLQCATIANAREIILLQTREVVRLLRKRDKGGAFTPLEAARIAMLDEIDAHVDLIDARAAELMTATPPDIAADRHWPQLGAPTS